jgi:predicted ATPase
MGEEKFLDAVGCGYENYKDIVINKICGIRLSNFRTFKDRSMDLGNVITVVSGKNGTMKSTLLGLIAHPFSSPNNAHDAFGNPLKTRHSDVFYLSPEKDSEQYIYYLRITTVEGVTFEEPIRVYKRLKTDGTYRHRLTVGKDNKEGRGNFSLNTSFVNLKRLIPIIDTNAKINDEEMEKSLEKFVSEGYMRILQKDAFSKPVQVSDKAIKQTFGPGKDAYYDYKSISSGEDNIGHILNKMHAFLQYKNDNLDALQGIFCIDEMEASLHPVAQINLFNFIYDWAKNNHIQVVINTHSLYLIQYVIELQSRLKNKEDIILNMISTAFVSDKNYNIIKNPDYNEAYKELTLKDIDDIHEIYKLFVVCEDDIAEYYLKRIIAKSKVLSRLEFLHGLNEGEVGNGCNGLKSLIKNGQKLLSNSIVFFDPDVDVSDLKKYKSKYLVLPSRYGMALEKEVVKYIYDLEGDDDFFRSFNKERDAFINEFSDKGILCLSDIEKIKKDNVKKYKNWADTNMNSFKKYVTYYVKHTDIADGFRIDLEKTINDMFTQKGLPTIFLK